MQLISVNVSLPKEVPYGNGRVTTGIFMEPAKGRVRFRTSSLEGDAQADRENHGGIYKAISV